MGVALKFTLDVFIKHTRRKDRKIKYTGDDQVHPYRGHGRHGDV